MLKSILLLLITLLTCASYAFACTSITLPASSTTENNAITIHTNHCLDCDNRLALVPPRTHPKKALHPVYGINAIFPRKSDGKRAFIYQGMPDQQPVAWIPEAAETYGVWESSYSLMNEKGLTFGESSCTSKIPAAGLDMPDSNGELGKAYFCIAALMTVGLERCADAICAIKIMGKLAEEYGFYGESYMGGETLTIADVSGDAWVFHVMQSWSSNISAIWVAQRVPNGHLAAVGNEFTIQKIPIDAEQISSGFMWSENIKSEAMKAGFWDGTGMFNFQEVYGTKSVLGKNHYATMRLHWIYSHTSPSRKLKFKDSPSEYKFSYPVDKKLSIEDLLQLIRANYEGTAWDLTKGVLAGPFGNPKRIEGGEGIKLVKGELPRPISIARTSHVHVGIAHPIHSASLFGPDESGTTVLSPFFTKTLQNSRGMAINETEKLYSKFYQVGRRDVYGYRDSAMWAFNMVANALNFNYQNMTAQFVRPALYREQAVMLKALRENDEINSVKLQDMLVHNWWSLYDKLVITYNDGTFNFGPGHDPKKPCSNFGYPASYLKEIGFDKDFWKSQSFDDVCHKRENAFKYLFVMAIGAVLGALISKHYGKSDSELSEPLLLRETSR